MSTKGVATVSDDRDINVLGNGRGDFLEEAVAQADLELHRIAVDGSNATASCKFRSRPPPIGHVRSGGGEISANRPGNPRMDTHASGIINGVDAARVSNELYGKVAPMTLDPRGA